MPSSLNQYASKVLADNPISLWSLDDDLSYIDLVGPTLRHMETWGVGAESYTLIENNNIDRPLSNEDCYVLTVGKFNNQNVQTVHLISPSVGKFININTDLSTITVGAFVNCAPKSTTAVSIGYAYVDPTFGPNYVSKRFSEIIPGKWMFISETFDLPEGMDTDYSVDIAFEYIEDPDNSSSFFINGVSVGQWSESFNSSTTGLTPFSIPEKIYGIQDGQDCLILSNSCAIDGNGYTLVDRNRLGLSSDSIPLVFGSQNSVTVSDTQSTKALLPANGFLNKSGQYRNYTLEFWLRALPTNLSPYKVIGPIANDSGIYLDQEFLTLKIGKYEKSYYVGEWYRPMLINLSVSSSRAVLFLNGESVVDIAIDQSQIAYPEMQINQYDTDWIAIYGNPEIYPFEIDCISLYGYLFNNTIAKKHWVYGQAVQNPESLNLQYGGSSVNIDYAFAKYANNYSYPKHAQWSSGTINNLTFDNKSLKNISPDKPTLIGNIIQNEVLTSALSYQNEDQNYLKIPENCFINIQDVSKNISGVLRGVYATFKDVENITDKQMLISLSDKNTGDSFDIFSKDGYINYALNIGNTIDIVTTTSPFIGGEVYTIGLDFSKVSKSYGYKVERFFAKASSLSMLIGGSGNSDNYTGHVYGFGLFNEYSIEEFSSSFNSRGLIFGTDDISDADGDADAGYYNTEFWQFIWDGGSVANYATTKIMSNATSYAVSFIEKDGAIDFNIASSGSWTSGLPLSYFAKNIIDQNGYNKYDLDFLQVNVDIPAPNKLVKVSSQGTGWKYSDLKQKFAVPSARTYAELDNPLFTGYNDYSDLAENTTNSYKIDTDGYMAKVYIYFKENSNGYSNPNSYYTNSVKLNDETIVEPGDEWINTKYEIVDNTIVYPPTGVDFNSISMFVEIKVINNSVTTKQVSISNLAISSMALNEISETPIGTRNSVDIYPYAKNKYYYDFKKKNPFSIYKGSTPHLYLNQTSGIRVFGTLDRELNRGIEIPINVNKVDLYRVIALQGFVKYDLQYFPYSPVEIFEIESNNTHLRFFVQAIHKDGKRGKIFCINMKTGQMESGIAFYINGKIVREPVISLKQWYAIGVYFSNQIECSLNTAALRINGPMMLNNISFYTSSRLAEILEIATRSWLGVKESGRLQYDWRYWEGSFKWFEALVLSTQSFYGVDPADIYNSYVGSTKLVIDDKSTIRANRYRFRVVNNDSVVNTTVNIA